MRCDHQGENDWYFSAGEDGFSKLDVHGPPWGDVLEDSLERLRFYEEGKAKEWGFDTAYRSVIDKRTEEEDRALVKKVKTMFESTISFAGFSPSMYAHHKGSYKHILEFDVEKIKKLEKPQQTLDAILSIIHKEMQPNKITGVD
jgi:hypothetical protein